MTKRNDLLDVIGTGEVINDYYVLVASGPLTHQPATLPYRVVLVIYHNPSDRKSPILVVWDQCWNKAEYSAAGQLSLESRNAHYANGDYFSLSKFPEAVKCFCKRVDKPEYYRSILRGL